MIVIHHYWRKTVH